MARAKRTSAILEIARRRLAGLKSISTPILGPNLSATAFETEINDLAAVIDRYNQILSTADQVLNDIVARERGLATSNRRILAAVGAQHGPDSSEYEQVGGTRQSERKRPTKKPKDGSGTGSGTGTGTP